MLNFTLLFLRLKRRYKNLLLWSLVWCIIGLLFASIFDSAAAENELFEELVSSYPEGLFDTLNISTNYLSSVETFISGQFLTLYTLIGSIYGLYLGVGEVGGKIHDKTIGAFLGKGVSRSSYYITQVVTNLLAIAGTSALVWSVIYLQFTVLTAQADISVEYFTKAAVSTSLLTITWSNLGQALGVFIEQQKAKSIGAAMIVTSFFLNNLGEFGGLPDWMTPLSLFYYLDLNLLRDSFALEWSQLGILILVTGVSLILGIIKFRHKNISL